MATTGRTKTTAVRRGATAQKAVAPASGPDRRHLLDVASRLLVEHGPEALTMRRLASEAGTSTMVLYTRFENRDGLMEALLTEGFRRFAETLGAVSAADPVEHMRLLGHAYRRFGRENPTYYRLMWGGATEKDWARAANGPTAQHGQRAFGALVLGVTRLLARADRPAREAEPLAMAVWSTVHGFVSLELCGAVPPGVDVEALYERTLRFIVSGLVGA